MNVKKLPVWTHEATVNRYEFLMYALRAEDRCSVIVYRSVETGEVWVRPREDFMGQFTPTLLGPTGEMSEVVDMFYRPRTFGERE